MFVCDVLLSHMVYVKCLCVMSCYLTCYSQMFVCDVLLSHMLCQMFVCDVLLSHML